MKADPILKIIKSLFNDILKFLRIENYDLFLETEEGLIKVTIKTEEPNLLIGYNGESLASLQLLASLMLCKKTGTWHKLFLNVNDWHQKREGHLQKLAANLAQKTKFSGREVQLTNLSAAERRIIHLYLKDHPDVMTVSEGEGSFRHLVIKPKQ